MAPFKTQNPNVERHVPNTIITRGVDEVEYDDRPAAEDIRLGSLVERVNAQFQLQSTDGAKVQPAVAVERRELGQLPVDDGFPTEVNDQLQHDRFFAGDTVWVAKLDKGHEALLLLAAGSAVTDGDPVLPDGAGHLRALDTTNAESDDNAVLQAAEDFDNSAAGATAEYVRMEVTT